MEFWFINLLCIHSITRLNTPSCTHWRRAPCRASPARAPRPQDTLTRGNHQRISQVSKQIRFQPYDLRHPAEPRRDPLSRAAGGSLQNLDSITKLSGSVFYWVLQDDHFKGSIDGLALAPCCWGSGQPNWGQHHSTIFTAIKFHISMQRGASENIIPTFSKVNSVISFHHRKYYISRRKIERVWLWTDRWARLCPRRLARCRSAATQWVTLRVT